MILNNFIQSPTKEIVLNGYEIRFSLKDSILFIEAEHISTSKLYSVNINKSETAKLTGELFSDVDSLYESIIQGLNKINTSINVSMSNDAILNFSYETIVLNKKKTFEFSIVFKEIEHNPITILQRNYEKLRNLIDQKDQKISQLQQYQSYYLKSSGIESEMEKQTLILESKIASEIKKQIRIGIESVESKIASEIEKQTQTINTRQLSVIENQLESRIGSKFDKISQNLENKIMIQMENIAITQASQIEKLSLTNQNKTILLLENLNQSLENKTILQMEKQTHSLEKNILIQMEKQTQILENKIISKIEKQIISGVEKESQLFKKMLSDYNEMNRTVLENEIGKQTQLIKTVVSNHFKSSSKTWLVSEFKQQITVSDHFLAQKNNTPNLIDSSLLQFDPRSVNSSFFIYSNKNRTITYNGNNHFRMIYLNKSLPKNHISFKFKIEKSKNNLLMIGICPFSILSSTGECWNYIGAYVYYGGGGTIFYNRNEVNSHEKVIFKEGSIITMTVNLLQQTIEWMQDNKLMHRMNLDNLTVNQEMYPCLHFYQEGDSVSLLNN